MCRDELRASNRRSMSGPEEGEILWHTGLFARLDSSFPKKCSNCGRVFATAKQYFTETEDLNDENRGLKACADDDTATVVDVFRNCPCGSTLMETFDDYREQLQGETARHLQPDLDVAGEGTDADDPPAGRWAGAWHEGLYPNGRDTFPKECRSCNRVFATPEEFFSNTEGIRADQSGLRESEDDDEQVIVEAFRNCQCGSTLMDSFSNRRDMSAAGQARRALFDRMLAYLVDNGIDADTARQELLTVARGGDSELLANIRPPEQVTDNEHDACHDGPRSRVLLVSPSQPNACQLEACLAGQPDIDFWWCAEADQALPAAREFRPTVILQDLSGDTADGLRRIGEFRHEPDCREVPVIAWLGEDDPDVRNSAFAAGVSDAVADRVDALEWLSRLRYHSAACLARRELDEATVELEKARDQLICTEKMASMGLLAAGVAHEINNPIAFVTSNLNSLDGYYRDVFSALDAGAENDAQHTGGEAVDIDSMRDDVGQILEECQDGMSRVRKIVDNLKYFSRSSGDDWRHADLHEELDRALSLAHNELKYKADVKREFGDLPTVECVPSELTQVFLNLLVNAAHAIGDRGDITITTSRGGAPRERQSWHAGGNDWVHVTIADSGAGMSEETRSRVFEPFFTTKEIGKGTGLGLSVSFGIIQNHGGDISVASEPGKGSVFTVCLPVTHEAG